MDTRWGIVAASAAAAAAGVAVAAGGRSSSLGATRPPKAMVERAVKAAQIYQGSAGSPMKYQQKLYERTERACQSIASKSGMDYNSVFEQVTEEAKRRGSITAQPGKHY